MTSAAIVTVRRAKAVWGSRAAALALVMAIASSTSCGDVVRQGTGGSFLIVSALEGAAGAKPTDFGGTLLSDVITVVDNSPTFFNDIGRVTFRLGLKDAGSPASPTTPAQNDAITINRYHVKFLRADGRNTQGVDVPYEFDGAFTLTVSAGDASAGFTMVRNIAKMEAPLAALRFNGVVLSTIAEVTFYGADQTGHEVKATARITIDFANFGDPSS
jgi:hypothetical protein